MHGTLFGVGLFHFHGHEPGTPFRLECPARAYSLPFSRSGVTEIFWPKYLHDLCLAVSYNLPKALAPFDSFVQRLGFDQRPAGQ